VTSERVHPPTSPKGVIPAGAKRRAGISCLDFAAEEIPDKPLRGFPG
jgi:hypothetical protein